MRNSLFSTGLICIAVLGLSACSANGLDHDFQKVRLLGGATDHNIAAQSIRPVDVPNSRGLTGQSGVRAVSAIARLNSGETAELSDVSASGISSEVDE